MSDMVARGDFFEEDEPVEDVLAVFERAEKHVTAKPVRSGPATDQTQHLYLPGVPSDIDDTLGETATNGELISH